MSDQASNLMMTSTFVSDALNRVVMNLIARSSKAEVFGTLKSVSLVMEEMAEKSSSGNLQEMS